MLGVGSGVYDRKYPGQLPATEEYAVAPGREYRLSFVEFDETGDYWDRTQLAIAANFLHNSPKPALLVIFIHGWHNNAADRGVQGDVQNFSAFLAKLAVSESTRGYTVHGVFLGWRGRLVQGPLDYITFLSRKDAATRVAGVPVTETIFALIRQARLRDSRASKAIVIGHSFGALVLEKAMAQAMIGSIFTQDAHHGGASFSAPADLVLLINSAGESIYAKELQDLLVSAASRNPRKSLGGINPDRPLIVSLTSKTDSATSGWFPRGTFLPRLFARRHYDWDKRRGASGDDVSQREYLTTTAGHNERLITHDVVPIGVHSVPMVSTVPLAAARENPALEENLRNPQGLTFATSRRVQPEQLDWWRIERRPNRKESPYWIMQVPRQIIHGHSPIFTEEGCAMMAAIFRITNPTSQPGPRQMKLQSLAELPQAPDR